MDLSVLLSVEGLISFSTLALLEIVLGIDNIVFVTILTNRLPEEERKRARTIGIGLALIMRLGLLLVLSWIIGLTKPMFYVGSHPFSGRDMILLAGGLFLIAKATKEIVSKVEVAGHGVAPQASSFTSVIIQVLLLDLVFSLDSVITAVGVADHLSVMALAMITAVAVMMIFAGPVGNFVNEHPSMQMLALSFLILIGAMLVIEGWGHHVDKRYIYFAMAYALAVNLLQLWTRREQRHPVELNSRVAEEEAKKALTTDAP